MEDQAAGLAAYAAPCLFYQELSKRQVNVCKRGGAW